MENSDYIIIPNPIYDVVFKYLMEDNESARIILSTLTGENIIKLEFEPTSHAAKIKDPENEKDIKLFHLDFTATVALPDGTEELIMIELQKANKASDIFRFKRYISANFQRKQKKEILNQKTKAYEERDFPIRLLPIFILNFRIENEINDLLIKTNRVKLGVFKDKQLNRQNEFIDNLTYDLIVIQLPNIENISKEEYENDEHKSKLFALLKLFDQQSQLSDNRHRLRVFRTLFPGFLERVISRLKSAYAENPELEDQMNAEDEYLAELIRRDNEIAFFKEKFDIEQKEKEEARKGEKKAKKGEEEAKKGEEEAKKGEEEAQKGEEEARKGEKDAKIRLIKMIKFLKQQGTPNKEILQITGLSEDEIKKYVG